MADLRVICRLRQGEQIWNYRAILQWRHIQLQILAHSSFRSERLNSRSSGFLLDRSEMLEPARSVARHFSSDSTHPHAEDSNCSSVRNRSLLIVAGSISANTVYLNRYLVTSACTHRRISHEKWLAHGETRQHSAL